MRCYIFACAPLNGTNTLPPNHDDDDNVVDATHHIVGAHIRTGEKLDARRRTTQTLAALQNGGHRRFMFLSIFLARAMCSYDLVSRRMFAGRVFVTGYR